MAEHEVNEMRHLHAVVRGQVQGVNYRRFVVDWGRDLGLSGTVRNLPGGAAVDVEAEGKQDDLERLLERLKAGPREAVVTKVEARWEAHQGRYAGFTISHS